MPEALLIGWLLGSGAWIALLIFVVLYVILGILGGWAKMIVESYASYRYHHPYPPRSLAFKITKNILLILGWPAFLILASIFFH